MTTAEAELRPERALQPTAFLFVLSVAVCALVPPAHLVSSMGSAGATRQRSAVASISALMEILLAPLVGALSDSIGRKPVLMLTLLAVLVVNSVAACFPVVPLIVASTFVSKCVVGLFFLSSGASLGDAYRTDPAKLAGASGTLFALVNAGFAVGIALSRFLPARNTLRWAYGISAGMAALATAVAGVAVRETMEPSQRVPFKVHTCTHAARMCAHAHCSSARCLAVAQVQSGILRAALQLGRRDATAGTCPPYRAAAAGASTHAPP